LRYRTLLILTIIIATSIPTAQATFVEMEKTHTPEKTEYFCGETLEFNITITVRTTAGGPILSIEDLKIIDYLAPGVTILPGNWTSTPSSNFTDYGNGTLLWDFGPGPFTTEPQATVAFNVTVNQDAPENTYLINTATAKYNETVSGAASAPTVTDTIRIIYPIINITKYCSGPILEGGWINYTIILTNHGHMDDENITLTDHLPPGTIYTPGTASATSGTLDESQLPGKLLWKGVLPNVTGLNTVNITIPVQDDPLEYSQQHTNNASFTELTGCERVERRWVTCNTNLHSILHRRASQRNLHLQPGQHRRHRHLQRLSLRSNPQPDHNTAHTPPPRSNGLSEPNPTKRLRRNPHQHSPRRGDPPSGASSK